MPRRKQPSQTLKIESRDGQVSAPGGNLANYFMRNVPLSNPPAWQEAEVWRRFVEKQPLAAICRDRIADHLNSLDWAIVARDSEQRDELKTKIKHYTKLFERGNAYYYDLDFSSHIEFIIKDLFTLPFGTACEIGRIDNDSNGKVVWVRPLDAGTLAPTLNFDYPVMQVAPNTGLRPVYLPRKFVSRVFLSPRTELQREGWGYAPPERIWRAIEMLVSGDNYYAQLLLNTPEAGVLDLGDMDKTSAEEWVKSLRDLLYGINPLKIPVLYEHTTKADWIPFGKPPSEILYDTTTMKYAAILCAGYGFTLSDIGFPTSSNGGETLAGTIRQERVSNSSGKSTAKKKTKAYFDKILPDSLMFTWIDYDDERNVSKGRATRLAQAAQLWVTNRMFLPSELRQQAIADGLISIDVPETVEPNDEEFTALQEAQNPFGAGGTVGSKTKTLGSPAPPSSGGQGEKIPQQTIQRNISKAEVDIQKSVIKINDILLTLLNKVKSNLSEEEMPIWEEYVDEYLIGKSDMEEDELKKVLDDLCVRARASIDGGWVLDFTRAIVDKLIADEESEIMAKADLDEDRELEAKVNQSAFYRDELTKYVKESLLYTVSNYSVLVARSVILEGMLDVDATEAVSNNIRVSKEIAKEVLSNLSTIVNSVYDNGRQFILDKGDSNAGS